MEAGQHVVRWLVLVFAVNFASSTATVELPRSFTIDYENDQFLKDGEPFHYVSGSFHYYRAPRAYWRDRLHKMRAAGLNAVSTYIEWSQHEPSPGNFVFTGELDLKHFIQLAQEEDLYVLLRPGPYICAERDLGGLPPWLLTLKPDIQLRTSDETYLQYADRYLTEVLTRMRPHLYGNGGPIILVQVENEYGSYSACDRNHTAHLRDTVKNLVGDAAVLYTTDGAGTGYLRCGKIPEVYATVDFGAGGDVNSSFDAQRQYEPHGPLVNSEFYPGWLTHWGEDLQTVGTQGVINTLSEMLSVNASVNFYMFFGGTNFGFLAGANYGDKYQPQLTSYDYDAPLTEAGDPTSKYFAIREAIGKFIPLPNITLPSPAPKGAYGDFLLAPVSVLINTTSEKDPVRSRFPLTFEELGQHYGFVLYETTLFVPVPDPAVLSIPDLSDRAIVMVNGVPRVTLSRMDKITSAPLTARINDKIQILVENQGRINYGEKLKDFKGFVSNVTLGGWILTDWIHTGFPLTDLSVVNNASDLGPGFTFTSPTFFKGTFKLPSHLTEILDTYLDPTGWGKGVAFLNGYNLGRYWPLLGPQVTLYVPGIYLKPYPEENVIILLELEYTNNPYTVTFTSEPILNKHPPSLPIHVHRHGHTLTSPSINEGPVTDAIDQTTTDVGEIGTGNTGHHNVHSVDSTPLFNDGFVSDVINQTTTEVGEIGTGNTGRRNVHTVDSTTLLNDGFFSDVINQTTTEVGEVGTGNSGRRNVRTVDSTTLLSHGFVSDVINQTPTEVEGIGTSNRVHKLVSTPSINNSPVTNFIISQTTELGVNSNRNDSHRSVRSLPTTPLMNKDQTSASAVTYKRTNEVGVTTNGKEVHQSGHTLNNSLITEDRVSNSINQATNEEETTSKDIHQTWHTLIISLINKGHTSPGINHTTPKASISSDSKSDYHSLNALITPSVKRGHILNAINKTTNKIGITSESKGRILIVPLINKGRISNSINQTKIRSARNNKDDHTLIIPSITESHISNSINQTTSEIDITSKKKEDSASIQTVVSPLTNTNEISQTIRVGAIRNTYNGHTLFTPLITKNNISSAINQTSTNADVTIINNEGHFHKPTLDKPFVVKNLNSHVINRTTTEVGGTSIIEGHLRRHGASTPFVSKASVLDIINLATTKVEFSSNSKDGHLSRHEIFTPLFDNLLANLTTEVGVTSNSKDNHLSKHLVNRNLSTTEAGITSKNKDAHFNGPEIYTVLSDKVSILGITNMRTGKVGVTNKIKGNQLSRHGMFTPLTNKGLSTEVINMTSTEVSIISNSQDGHKNEYMLVTPFINRGINSGNNQTITRISVASNSTSA